jgi:hypothetical protein
MMLLSIDPGLTTGWAIWNVPKLLLFGDCKGIEEFFDSLLLPDEWEEVDQIVMEDYKIRPSSLNKNWGHEWNNGPALQVIGGVKLWARSHSIPYHMSQPSILPVGCGYIGYPYNKKKHTPNYISAIAHGAWYQVKNKLALPGDFVHALAT